MLGDSFLDSEYKVKNIKINIDKENGIITVGEMMEKVSKFKA